MEKPLLPALVLVLCCLLAAGCKTTPSAGSSQPGAKPAQSAQSPGSAAQGSTGQAQQPAGQEQQGSGQTAAAARRPGSQDVLVNRLKKLGTEASTGLSDLVRRIETFLGIRPMLGRRSASVEVSAPRIRGAPLLPPDLVPVIVTAAILLGGGCLALAAVIAGRRRG